jgi:hypothetical protein
MKKLRATLAVPLLLVLVVSCASVGASDPLVVRAEDALSNSLSVYDGLMSVHFANSTRESPEVYRAIEAVRVKFPIAWRAVNDGKKSYRAGVTGSADKLTAALDALQAIVAQASALMGGR